MKIPLILICIIYTIFLAGCESEVEKKARQKEERNCMITFAAAETGIITDKIRSACESGKWKAS